LKHLTKNRPQKPTNRNRPTTRKYPQSKIELIDITDNNQVTKEPQQTRESTSLIIEENDIQLESPINNDDERDNNDNSPTKQPQQQQQQQPLISLRTLESVKLRNTIKRPQQTATTITTAVGTVVTSDDTTTSSSIETNNNNKTTSPAATMATTINGSSSPQTFSKLSNRISMFEQHTTSSLPTSQLTSKPLPSIPFDNKKITNQVNNDDNNGSTNKTTNSSLINELGSSNMFVKLRSTANIKKSKFYFDSQFLFNSIQFNLIFFF
jgi:hypothetical protein